MPVIIPFTAWLRATWLGWLLGVPLIALFALASEALGVGGAQVFATAVGLALPFLVSDVSRVRHWGLPYSLAWDVAIGGLIVGVAQAVLLRSRMRGTAWWVAASAAGWALAAAAAALADTLGRHGSLRGLVGALIYLGTVAVGGGVLGIATGSVLGRVRHLDTTSDRLHSKGFSI